MSANPPPIVWSNAIVTMIIRSHALKVLIFLHAGKFS
jgi:hypothetical protein